MLINEWSFNQNLLTIKEVGYFKRPILYGYECIKSEMIPFTSL